MKNDEDDDDDKERHYSGKVDLKFSPLARHIHFSKFAHLCESQQHQRPAETLLSSKRLIMLITRLVRDFVDRKSESLHC